jgi:hypothetical protein
LTRRFASIKPKKITKKQGKWASTVKLYCRQDLWVKFSLKLFREPVSGFSRTFGSMRFCGS